MKIRYRERKKRTKRTTHTWFMCVSCFRMSVDVLPILWMMTFTCKYKSHSSFQDSIHIITCPYVIDWLYILCASLYLSHKQCVKSSLFQSHTKWLCQVPFDIHLTFHFTLLASRAACCLPCLLTTPTTYVEEVSLSKSALCQVRPLSILTWWQLG